jgi:hypothetical protein
MLGLRPEQSLFTEAIERIHSPGQTPGRVIDAMLSRR